MSCSRNKRTVLLVALLGALACTRKEEVPAEKEHAVVGATVGAAESQRFTETVDAVGAVVPRVGHMASLAAPAPTRVANVLVAPGARVNKGDALVELEQAPFDAALRSAEAALTAAQKAADRAQRLADAGVSPRKEAETAASELALAQLNATNARRAKELSTLRAPLSGVVTRLNAVLGANVEPTQVLVEVADNSVVDAVLTVSPTDAARVRPGQAVALHAGADAGGGPVASARVADVSVAVDTASRGVSVRAELTGGASALRLGETVFGRIAVGEHANAVVVPIEALVPTGEGFKVFVVNDEGMALSRAVVVGGRSEKGAWIKEGLKAGEKVVTKGAYGVDDSASVGAQKGEGGREKGDDKAAEKVPEKKDANAAGKAGKKP